MAAAAATAASVPGADSGASSSSFPFRGGYAKGGRGTAGGGRGFGRGNQSFPSNSFAIFNSNPFASNNASAETGAAAPPSTTASAPAFGGRGGGFFAGRGRGRGREENTAAVNNKVWVRKDIESNPNPSATG